MYLALNEALMSSLLAPHTKYMFERDDFKIVIYLLLQDSCWFDLKKSNTCWFVFWRYGKVSSNNKESLGGRMGLWQSEPAIRPTTR